MQTISSGNMDNICKICGGVLQVTYTITFNGCVPKSMSYEPSPFPENGRLCPGHSVRDTTIIEELTKGLLTQDIQEKHQALRTVAQLLNLDL